MDTPRSLASRSERPATTDYQAFLVFGAIAVALAAAGVLHYTLGPQVEFLWLRDCGVWCGQALAHRYRYLVSLPGLQLGDWFGPRGQAAYVSLFVAANCWLWLRIMRGINHGRLFVGLGFLGAIATQSQMNGRGVFVWTAWLLTILLCRELLAGRQIRGRALLLLPVTLLLAAVSTGVFVVVFSTLAACFALNALRATTRAQTVTSLAGFSIVVIPFGNYFGLAIAKNLAYYGGMAAMVRHGLAKYLGLTEGLAIVVVAALAVAVVLTFLRPELARVCVLMLPALAGGVFGITVLTLALVPALLVFDALSSDFIRARTDR